MASWLDNLLGSGGFDDAKNDLHQYMDPYINHGTESGTALTQAYQNLMNPGALQSQWMKSYQESPMAQQAQSQAQQQGLSSASSMGLMGSSPALQAIQGGTTQIGLADRSNYLHDMMSQYLSGANIAQNMYGTGYNASQNMAQGMAQADYGSDEAPWATLGKLGGTIGGAILGGVTGGPMGALAGASAGSKL